MAGLDRRKHDVDIIERVLGRIRDSETSDVRSRVVDVDLPGGEGSEHPTLELTIGLEGTSSDRRSGPRRRS